MYGEEEAKVHVPEPSLYTSTPNIAATVASKNINTPDGNN